MSQKQSAGKNIALMLILNIFIVIGAVFLANYIFVEWQKVPSEYYGYKTIYLYHEQYGHIDKVAKAIKGSILAGVVMWLVLNVVVFTALFSKPKRELHGSARFANDAEIRRAGFLPNDKERAKLQTKKPSNPSILIGKHKNKFLEFFGNEFMFVAAPTRSGKGVAIVIPNLLHYPDSVMVLDVKNENWDLTAGFRAKYQDVYLFSPNPTPQIVNGEKIYRSHRYNPLDYISRDEFERMKDIGDIANIFFPANSGNDTSDYFNSQAQRLFTGLVLYMIETPERPCTLAELIKLTTPTAMPLHEWIPDVINKRKEEERELSVECIEAMMAFVNVDSDNTRSSILATLMSPLNVFTDPMVATATSKSDFRFDDVRRKKMTIYVGIQPNELERFSKLLNVFFSQLININTRVLPEHDPNLKYQCLVLLDEFTSLGRVNIIQKSIAYIAGYNVRLMPIFQSTSQVEDAYSRDGANAILSNIACQIEFTPTTIEQAEHLSKRLGTQTVKGKSVSRNRGKGGGGSVSTSDQSRALMLPQELMEMGDEEEIILFRRTKPIKCEKAFYYSNPQVFGRRMQSLSRPAKGLPIPPKCEPPILDVVGMLKIMRGIVGNDVKTYQDLQPVAHYKKHHANFVDLLGEAFGFSKAELAELDALEAKAKADKASQSNVINEITADDSDDDDIIEFDLSNPDEFEKEFVDEFNF